MSTPEATPRRSQSPTLWGFICLALMFASPLVEGALLCGAPLFVASLVLSIVAMLRGETIGGVVLFLLTFGGAFTACLFGAMFGLAAG